MMPFAISISVMLCGVIVLVVAGISLLSASTPASSHRAATIATLGSALLVLGSIPLFQASSAITLAVAIILFLLMRSFVNGALLRPSE